MPTLTIGDRMIGTSHPTYIVADLSANHNQDFDRAVPWCPNLGPSTVLVFVLLHVALLLSDEAPKLVRLDALALQAAHRLAQMTITIQNNDHHISKHSG